jgi:alkylation response protein AidB-like acyl-CoA dehydrogenase
VGWTAPAHPQEATMSDNFYIDNDDLRFYIEQAVDWDALVELTEHGSAAEDRPASTRDARDMYEDILKEFGKFCAKQVDPHVRKIDQEGTRLENGEVVASPTFDKIFKGLKKLDVFGLPLPRELGGLNTPALVYMAAAEMLARGDVSCMTHFGFHTGVAMTLYLCALRDPRTKVVNGRVISTPYDEAIRACCAGEAWGCMVLTEPGAGSDLGQIRTTAKLQADGSWRVTGEKIFITSGHGQYQLVLARSEDPDRSPGLKGLSLFLCEQKREGKTNVRIAKVEHKIGHNGSPTCVLVYEDSHGELIGRRGEGFELMLLLMNFARIAVGFESMGIIEAAYRSAKEFAEQRVTMGKTVDRHEMIADYLEDMNLYRIGIRALAFETAQKVERSMKLEQILKFDPPADETARAEMQKRVSRLKRQTRDMTPLLKYISSEKAVEHARMAMQILGGVGYTQEYLPEKLLRDSLVLPIYEGTSQIQSLMALKDQLMQGLRDPRRFIVKMARANWKRVAENEPMEKQLSKLFAMKYKALQTILVRIASNKLKSTYELPIGAWTDALFSQWDPKLDFAPGLLHAERLTRILADVTIARILVKYALKFPERRVYAERFMARSELRCRFWLSEIEEHGEALLADLSARNVDDTKASAA